MMRKTKQEITDPLILEKMLSSSVICRLAMNDGEVPYILPVNFGYREGYIYIHSAPEGKKIDLLRRNPRVSFEVEDMVEVTGGKKACQWSTRYRSVIGRGEVDILEEEESKQAGLEIIMARHGAPHLTEFDPENMERMVILRLKITAMKGKQSDR